MIKNIEHNILLESQHGLEIEALRVDSKGSLSQKKHPLSLGSNLVNPFITTDFSESQVEMVTPPKNTTKESIEILNQIKKFTSENIEKEELLWHSSMPPKIKEEEIEVANFGNSPEGIKKTLYRKGLAKRYGKKMQVISGVHYNFSFGKNLIKQILETKRFPSPSDIYMQVARNYLRKLPFVTYLSGGSPAFDKSLSNYKNHFIKKFKNNTFYAPYATSLRMSEIGYTSEVQKNINISLNSLEAYIKNLNCAVNTVYKPYTQFSAQEQINSHFLQIENELYLPIRPKQITHKNESVLNSLINRGILYIELRSIDINIEEISGIDQDFLDFLHIVLLDCLFEKKKMIEKNEWKEIFQNLSLVVWQGRDKNLKIYKDHQHYNFHDLGAQFIESLFPIAEILDKSINEERYYKVLKKYFNFWKNPNITPSGKIIDHILDKKVEFSDWVLEKSQKKKRKLKSEIFFLENFNIELQQKAKIKG